MANDWYTADNAHLLRSKKGSLTAWRNADDELVAADCVATNEFIAGRLYEPIGMSSPLATGASYLPHFKTTSYVPGTWEEICYFQTGFDLYPAMGVCATTDDTPAASYYTHTHTIRTTQTPTNQGRHLERENPTDAESERLDILGMMLSSYHVECSEASPVAIQHTKWNTARVLNSTDDSTDDIAAASLTDIPFTWKDFAFTFTYNSNPIEANIIGWSLDIQNTVHFTGLDTNGFYSIGRYIPLTYITTTLEIMPYGSNPFELIREPLESYAGDLDLTVVATRTATYDLITFTHDKLYCQPFIINAEKKPGSVEKYLLVLSQLDTGSLSISEVNDYDDDYYET